MPNDAISIIIVKPKKLNAIFNIVFITKWKILINIHTQQHAPLCLGINSNTYTRLVTTVNLQFLRTVLMTPKSAPWFSV